MGAQLIPGSQIAANLRCSLKTKIEQRLAQGLCRPRLIVIQIGQHPASTLYVHRKQQACAEVGILSDKHTLPETTTETELLNFVHACNQDPQIHGILLQLPLPPHLSPAALLEAISPQKDVDGFHPFNMGRLALRRPTLRPCTPYGVIRLLEHISFDFKASHVVLVGVSNIVGRPMGLELLLMGATVTSCHRFTPDLTQHLQRADAVIVAVGRPGFIQGHSLKPGCVVIDVGINRLPDGRLCGDVDFESASGVAAWITPVPGGVGPMTVATLLENTLLAAQLQDKVHVQPQRLIDGE